MVMSVVAQGVACVAGGISRASAFVFGSEAANSLAGKAREVIYGGSAAARPLTNPASYAGYAGYFEKAL